MSHDLKRLCINDSGRIHTIGSTADRSIFRLPPFYVESRTELGLDTSGLIESFYQVPDNVTAGDVYEALWDCCTMLTRRGSDQDALERINRMLPDLPITRASAPSAIGRIALLLPIGGLAGGRFILKPGSALLLTPHGSITLSSRAIEIAGNRKLRYRTTLRTPVSLLLRSPHGRALKSKVALGALHRYLCGAFPALVPQITALCCAVVHAGPEFQDALVSTFDVRVVPPSSEDVPPDCRLWLDALKVVETCQQLPYDDLWISMRGLVPQDEFVEIFGTGRRHRNRLYPYRVRRKHRDAIYRKLARFADEIKNESDEAHQSKDAETLLKLLKRIG